MLSFLLDMGIPPKISRLLQEKGHESVHVSDIGMSTATDQELVQTAVKNNQTIITTDKDFSRLVMMNQEYDVSGVITVRLNNPTAEEISKRLRVLFDILKENEISASLITIQKTKIRRRPIHL